MDAIFNAGFYSQYLWVNQKKIEKTADFSLQERMQWLSAFSLRQISNSRIQNSVEDNLRKAFYVYANIISRGLPTLAPLSIERSILNYLEPIIHIQENEIHGAIEFVLDTGQHTKKQEEQWFSSLAKAHFPIDPRIDPGANTDFNYGSSAEKLFHTVYLPQLIGEALPLLLEPQRGFESMLDHAKAVSFISQRCDFSVEVGDTKLVFEVDGQQHDVNIRERSHDNYRDSALSTAGWRTFRVPTECIHDSRAWENIDALNQQIQSSPELRILNENHNSALWENDLDRKALYAVLAPYAAARIQRTILLALQNGNLRFTDNVWKFVLIERDVRCGYLAIFDFVITLGKLFDLMGINISIPKIELYCFYTHEFSDRSLRPTANLQCQSDIDCFEEIIDKFQEKAIPAQVIIDHSTLSFQGYQYPGEAYYDQSIRSDGVIFLLRNAHHFVEQRTIESDYPIVYGGDGPEFEETLKFFLQNIFRKVEFRPNQIDILKRSLTLKPVIGLLPTGAGKSICYQLSALLQPGVTIVIDPLVSLMIDQVENLQTNYAIDWVGHISGGQSAEEKSIEIQRMVDGQYLIIFISPERLQNKDFRRKLGDLCINHSVPYAVIDEAHCVSEWGHDFRTSYLNLSAVIRHWCVYSNDTGPYIPAFLALTGTASYSVLSDVQREIGINDEAAKIYPKDFNREELKFDAISVPSNEKFDRLKMLLKGLPKQYNCTEQFFFQPSNTGVETFSGIIFVPHVNGTYGAYPISRELDRLYPSQVRYFCGKAPRESTGDSKKYPIMSDQEFLRYKTETQRGFKNNEFCLLVSTKAFGMGIDKPNIRYIIHYNIPDSLEAYYQEAGRGGRDRKDAYCTIIFSDEGSDQDRDTGTTNWAPESTNSSRNNKKEGDISRLLFLHGRSFQGEEKEFENAIALLNKYIYPTLNQSQYNERWKQLIKFDDEEEYARQEKAIYRLMTIGLVGDYTVDHRRSSFEVRFVRRHEEEYIQSLQQYIQRYRTIELSGMISDSVFNRPGKTVIEKCLSYLLSFVYEEIEKKRCAAIRSMAEVARRASALPTVTERNRYIHDELMNYLNHSQFTDDLKSIASEFLPERWREVLQKKDNANKYLLHTVDGARQLLGGSRRALESDPDYPGLLFISVLGRLLLPDQEESTIRSEFHHAVESLKTVQDDLCEHALNTILDCYEEWLSRTQHYENWYQWFATVILQAYPFRSIARRCATVVPERSALLLVSFVLDDLKKLNKRVFGYQQEVINEQHR